MPSDAKERIAKLQKEAQDLVAAMIEKDEALAKLRTQRDDLDRQLGTLRQEHGALREQYNIVCQKTGSVDATVAAQRQQIATLTASLRAAETALAGQQHKAEQMMTQFLAAEHAARSSLETSALAQSALLDSLERRHVELSEREVVVRSRDRDMSARERELVRKELAAQKLDAELREKQAQLDKQQREMAEFTDAFVRQKIDAIKSKPPPPVERPPPLTSSSEPSSPKVLSPLSSPRDDMARTVSARRNNDSSSSSSQSDSTSTSPHAGAARTTSQRGRALPQPQLRRDRSQSAQDRVLQLRILYRVADGKVQSMASDSSGYADAQAELQQIVAELAELGAGPVDLERKPSGRQLPQLPKKDVDLTGSKSPPRTQPPQQQAPPVPLSMPPTVSTIASGRSSVVPASKVPSDRLSTAVSALPHDDDEAEDGSGAAEATPLVEESWKEVEEKEEAAVAAKTDWYVCFTEDGDEYYYNPSTDETSWELPPGAHRTLMNMWDAPSNPNDMNVEDGGDGDDGAASTVQACRRRAAAASAAATKPAGPEMQRRMTQMMGDIATIVKCQAYVRGMLARRVSLRGGAQRARQESQGDYARDCQHRVGVRRPPESAGRPVLGRAEQAVRERPARRRDRRRARRHLPAELARNLAHRRDAAGDAQRSARQRQVGRRPVLWPRLLRPRAQAVRVQQLRQRLQQVDRALDRAARRRDVSRRARRHQAALWQQVGPVDVSHCAGAARAALRAPA
jgi:hypothetical protein